MDIQIFQNFVVPSKMGIHIFTNFNLPPIPAVSSNASSKKRAAPVDRISGPSTKKIKSEPGHDQEVFVKQEQLDGPQDTSSNPNNGPSTKRLQTLKNEDEEGSEEKESNAKSEEGGKPYTGEFATRAEYVAYVRSLAAECGLHMLMNFR